MILQQNFWGSKDKFILRVYNMLYRINRFINAEGKEKYCLLGEVGKHIGEGNFCGWYTVEYYINAYMVGYIENTESYTEYCAVNKVIPKLQIHSVYGEERIETQNEEEAIMVFENRVAEWIKEEIRKNRNRNS